MHYREREDNSFVVISMIVWNIQVTVFTLIIQSKYYSSCILGYWKILCIYFIMWSCMYVQWFWMAYEIGYCSMFFCVNQRLKYCTWKINNKKQTYNHVAWRVEYTCKKKCCTFTHKWVYISTCNNYTFTCIYNYYLLFLKVKWHICKHPRGPLHKTFTWEKLYFNQSFFFLW